MEINQEEYLPKAVEGYYRILSYNFGCRMKMAEQLLIGLGNWMRATAELHRQDEHYFAIGEIALDITRYYGDNGFFVLQKMVEAAECASRDGNPVDIQHGLCRLRRRIRRKEIRPDLIGVSAKDAFIRVGSAGNRSFNYGSPRAVRVTGSVPNNLSGVVSPNSLFMSTR